jgi:hypothetical protein
MTLATCREGACQRGRRSPRTSLTLRPSWRRHRRAEVVSCSPDRSTGRAAQPDMAGLGGGLAGLGLSHASRGGVGMGIGTASTTPYPLGHEEVVEVPPGVARLCAGPSAAGPVGGPEPAGLPPVREKARSRLAAGAAHGGDRDVVIWCPPRPPGTWVPERRGSGRLPPTRASDGVCSPASWRRCAGC